MQQGGDGDRDLVHRPRRGDIAEVDDSVGQCAGGLCRDHIVVGDVEVADLNGQP
jgi:hypothetical protein